MKLPRHNSGIAALLAGVLAAGGMIITPTPVNAGQKEWATAGKILAGAAGVIALDQIFNNRCYTPCPPAPYYRTEYRTEVRHIYREPVYSAVPVTEYRVVRPCPPPRRPVGHYEIRQEQVWVPGEYERQWVPPVCSEVWNGRCYVTREIEPGHFERVWVPGHYETQEYKTWVQDY